jgi:hypothetical protein
MGKKRENVGEKNEKIVNREEEDGLKVRLGIDYFRFLWYDIPVCRSLSDFVSLLRQHPRPSFGSDTRRAE